MTEQALELRGVSAWYGAAVAIQDARMSVAADEVVAILGHNGAGKSTLLRAIARVHRQVQGTITVLGADVTSQDASRVARAGVSFVREGAPVMAQMTVLENLELARSLAIARRETPGEVDEAFDWFPALGERPRVRAGMLSGGQRQMLAIAAALVSKPRLLLLDEPSAGLAPVVAGRVFDAIRSLCAAGLAVVVAEQNSDWVDGFAHRRFVLETGRLFAAASTTG